MDTILEQTCDASPAVGDVRVVLRRWKAGTRTIIALLPDRQSVQNGTCKAFELAYGRRLEEVDYRAVIAKTVAADNRNQEAVDLLAELTSWGMNLKIVLSAGRTLAVREAPAT
jgi:hypothetical protein